MRLLLTLMLATVLAAPAFGQAPEPVPELWREVEILSFEELLERVRPLAVGDIDRARLEAIELRAAIVEDACKREAALTCTALRFDITADLEQWLAELERKRVIKLEACLVFLLEGRDDDPVTGEPLRRECASHLTAERP